MKFSFDMGAVTAGDIEYIEEELGIDFVAFQDKVSTGGPPRLRGKEMVGLLYLAGRQANPEFSLADARAVKLGEIEAPAVPTVAPAAPNRAVRRTTARNGAVGTAR